MIFGSPDVGNPPPPPLRRIKIFILNKRVEDVQTKLNLNKNLKVICNYRYQVNDSV